MSQPPSGRADARKKIPDDRAPGGGDGDMDTFMTEVPGNDNRAALTAAQKSGPVIKGDLKRRFFVAVMPPPGTTVAITDLRGKGPAEWDWKGQEDFHISLAFPGMLGEGQLSRLLTALANVRHEPFDAQFTGLAYFLRDPHARSRTAQNVLWARPDHAADNQLRSLHYKISRALADNQLDYGIKDITPHLTVAKVPANDNSLIESFAAAHNGHAVTPSWRCDRFGVYETLDRADPRHPANNGGRGTRYVRVAEFILKP